jgi:hypothetical protein
MRSRFFTAVVLCSFGLASQGCAASGDDTGTGVVTKKDSGVDGSSTNKDSGSAQPDSSVTNPPVDSGSTTLPPPADTGTPPDDTYTPPADTYVPPADTFVPPVDTGSVGTTGNACTSSATCGSAGNICVAFQAPVCAGAPCTNPPATTGYKDYSPCDGNSGVCSPNTTLNDGTGYCVPQCAVPLNGGAASGCLAGDTCIVQILNSAATGAIGSCEGGACTADTQCSATSATYTKCQKETLNCVKPADYKTFGANGAACTISTAGVSTPSCVCLAASPTTVATKGYCANICITGDAAHGCPTGYVCDPLLNATYFTAIPTGVTGYCSKSCTTSTGCPTGTTCQSFGGTKVCAP